MNEIEDIYTSIPIYGYRRVTIELRFRGFVVNHKRVQHLMQATGRRAIYPGKKTTIKNAAHKIYKYLLRGLKIEYPNQVWQVDITYIKVGNGFVYLTCLIDVFSRKVMGWSLSTFLDTESCLEALHIALKLGTPKIVNSDQGCQFTSNAWVEDLLNRKITISMDGKGRWADNVYVERLCRTIKQEAVRLHRFDTVEQARHELGKFIEFYNSRRFHQKLNYHTPDAVYKMGLIPTKNNYLNNLLLCIDLRVRGWP